MPGYNSWPNNRSNGRGSRGGGRGNGHPTQGPAGVSKYDQQLRNQGINHARRATLLAGVPMTKDEAHGNGKLEIPPTLSNTNRDIVKVNDKRIEEYLKQLKDNSDKWEEHKAKIKAREEALAELKKVSAAFEKKDAEIIENIDRMQSTNKRIVLGDAKDKLEEAEKKKREDEELKKRIAVPQMQQKQK
ncbi:hypothetical protein K461DRAFT_324061 [Myriangium duriaei CBS 260.36]|uniref:Uncharacterized protein n=1 Tax=Myriangium duriaei CBS 260.36 TaxID=1168546 RepID=A0A9P4IT91_9PEZI|nr:hypothetical protein K461DRAFT_324061 [Myriangium duriaei CBS 260.36]